MINFLVEVGLTDSIVLYMFCFLSAVIVFCFVRAAILSEEHSLYDKDSRAAVNKLIVGAFVLFAALFTFFVQLAASEADFVRSSEKNVKTLESLSEVKKIGTDDSSGEYLLNLCLNGVGFEGLRNKDLTKNINFYCGDNLSRVILKNVSGDKVSSVKDMSDSTTSGIVKLKLYRIAYDVIGDLSKFNQTEEQIKKVMPHLKSVYGKILVEVLGQEIDKLDFLKIENRLKFKRIAEKTASDCYALSVENCEQLKTKVKDKFEKSKKLDSEIRSLDSDMTSSVSKL